MQYLKKNNNFEIFSRIKDFMPKKASKVYEIVKLFSSKLPIQKLDGVLKSVPTLVHDNSICTFPQKN
jgi:hypothetical protein